MKRFGHERLDRRSFASFSDIFAHVPGLAKATLSSREGQNVSFDELQELAQDACVISNASELLATGLYCELPSFHLHLLQTDPIGASFVVSCA